MAKRISKAVRELHAQAAADYAAHNGKDPAVKAEEQTAQVMGRLAAQRGANRLWGTPPESRNGGE